MSLLGGRAGEREKAAARPPSPPSAALPGQVRGRAGGIPGADGRAGPRAEGRRCPEGGTLGFCERGTALHPLLRFPERKLRKTMGENPLRAGRSAGRYLRIRRLAWLERVLH